MRVKSHATSLPQNETDRHQHTPPQSARLQETLLSSRIVRCHAAGLEKEGPATLLLRAAAVKSRGHAAAVYGVRPAMTL